MEKAVGGKEAQREAMKWIRAGRRGVGEGCGMRDPGPHSRVGGREGTRKVGEGSDQASVSPLKSFKVTWSNFKARLS